jgi:hypothetical protein
MVNGLGFNEAAVLIWAPEDGSIPIEDAFGASSLDPKGFWLLTDALREAVETDRPGLTPWIKTGGALLGREQARSMYAAAGGLIRTR